MERQTESLQERSLKRKELAASLAEETWDPEDLGSRGGEHVDDPSPPLEARRRLADVAKSSAYLNTQGKEKNPSVPTLLKKRTENFKPRLKVQTRMFRRQ